MTPPLPAQASLPCLALNPCGSQFRLSQLETGADTHWHHTANLMTPPAPVQVSLNGHALCQHGYVNVLR